MAAEGVLLLAVIHSILLVMNDISLPLSYHDFVICMSTYPARVCAKESNCSRAEGAKTLLRAVGWRMMGRGREEARR